MIFFTAAPLYVYLSCSYYGDVQLWYFKMAANIRDCGAEGAVGKSQR